MKEYMVHIWGGAWNHDANPSIEKDLGIKEGYHYFSNEEDKNNFISKLQLYRHLGLMTDIKYGEMSHKDTIALIDFKYNNEIYSIEYNFGKEYEEESARFMFYDGNYSCDCNRSLFINKKYENFPDMSCGDNIEMVSFRIEYR